MPLHEGGRVSFSTIECQRLLQALAIARDALRAKAADPATDEELEMDCEAVSATFDQLHDEIRSLETAALRSALDPPIEDR